MPIKKNQPLCQRVTHGKFQNIDMRVGKVLSAPMAEGTDKPCRVARVDMGHLGEVTSVGQFALVPEAEMVAHKVVVVANFGPRPMGPYTSEVLILGAPHPESPDDQEQATPVYVKDIAVCGDRIF